MYAASSGELLDVVRGLDDEHRNVVLVGHNPGMEGFVHLLTDAWVEMVTSALAVVDLPGTWSDTKPGVGTLRTSGRPPT